MITPCKINVHNLFLNILIYDIFGLNAFSIVKSSHDEELLIIILLGVLLRIKYIFSFYFMLPSKTIVMGIGPIVLFAHK